MSVIKNKRSLSELEFFHNAIKLRKEMTGLLLRDFGMKARNKDTQVIPKLYKMEKEDGEEFLKLCEQYKIVSLVETYPEWLIREFRESILLNLRELIKNITSANSIYPMYMEDVRGEVKSWLGSMEKLNAYRTCQNIRQLYRSLFSEDLP